MMIYMYVYVDEKKERIFLTRERERGPGETYEQRTVRKEIFRVALRSLFIFVTV